MATRRCSLHRGAAGRFTPGAARPAGCAAAPARRSFGWSSIRVWRPDRQRHQQQADSSGWGQQVKNIGVWNALGPRRSSPGDGPRCRSRPVQGEASSGGEAVTRLPRGAIARRRRRPRVSRCGRRAAQRIGAAERRPAPPCAGGDRASGRSWRRQTRPPRSPVGRSRSAAAGVGGAGWGVAASISHRSATPAGTGEQGTCRGSSGGLRAVRRRPSRRRGSGDMKQTSPSARIERSPSAAPGWSGQFLQESDAPQEQPTHGGRRDRPAFELAHRGRCTTGQVGRRAAHWVRRCEEQRRSRQEQRHPWVPDLCRKGLAGWIRRA